MTTIDKINTKLEEIVKLMRKERICKFIGEVTTVTETYEVLIKSLKENLSVKE